MSTLEPLTPIVWQSDADRKIGMVDFDTDDGETVATIHVEPEPDGTHTVRIETHRDGVNVSIRDEAP